MGFEGGEMEICLHFATFMQNNESALKEPSHGVLMWSMRMLAY